VFRDKFQQLEGQRNRSTVGLFDIVNWVVLEAPVSYRAAAGIAEFITVKGVLLVMCIPPRQMRLEITIDFKLNIKAKRFILPLFEFTITRNCRSKVDCACQNCTKRIAT
jgi:hypothetical protein